MQNTRGIRRILKAQPFVEGAGVHLKRAFGFREVPQLDPFLLLDDFHSGRPIVEPVDWPRPIVMNTQEELETVFEEYRQGSFIYVSTSGRDGEVVRAYIGNRKSSTTRQTSLRCFDGCHL